MPWIQVLHNDMLIVGDEKRVDMYRKAGVPADDERAMAAVLFARQHGLVPHTWQKLTNEVYDFDFVKTMFDNDLMVDSTYELFVTPEHQHTDSESLAEVLPRRQTVPEYGPAYLEGLRLP